MAKTQFRYNPQTLSFEPLEISLTKKLANLTIRFGLSLIVALIVFTSYSYFFDTPKEKVLKRENSEIALKFELLDKTLSQMDQVLADMQQRDNHIYRSIFEADTIPSSLRLGGIGGVNRFDELKNFNNSELLINVASKLDQISWKTYIQSKSYDEVIDLAKNKEKMIQSIPAIQPVSVKDLGRVSAHFGLRSDPFTKERRFHHGIDFVGPKGAPIYASGNGKVILAEYSFFGYGNVVVIDHGFGYKSRYAHLKGLEIKAGDVVTRGQVVGTLGNSGRSTGPHLHYEVIYRNRPVDPLNYFNEMSTEEYDLMVSNIAAME